MALQPPSIEEWREAGNREGSLESSFFRLFEPHPAYLPVSVGQQFYQRGDFRGYGWKVGVIKMPEHVHGHGVAPTLAEALARAHADADLRIEERKHAAAEREARKAQVTSVTVGGITLDI